MPQLLFSCGSIVFGTFFFLLSFSCLSVCSCVHVHSGRRLRPTVRILTFTASESRLTLNHGQYVGASKISTEPRLRHLPTPARHQSTHVGWSCDRCVTSEEKTRVLRLVWLFLDILKVFNCFEILQICMYTRKTAERPISSIYTAVYTTNLSHRL